MSPRIKTKKQFGELQSKFKESQIKLEESLKLFMDYTKFIGTLDTASILVMAAFLGKSFPNPISKYLIISSVISLLVSIIAVAVTPQFIIGAIGYSSLFILQTDNIEDNFRKFSRMQTATTIGLFISSVGFATGILLFGLTAISTLE
jgi:hypothetical protein